MEKGEIISKLIGAGWTPDQAHDIAEVLFDNESRQDKQTRVVRSEETR